jgi:type I restriction enzyme S subunit
MNPARLLTHFDRISDAPGAIPRLRRFVLDLAVRGKLVEQEPNDEPASELIKRIQAEKVRLVKEGKIRSPRAWDSSDENGEPFLIPSGWLWCRLSDVGAIVGGGTPPSTDADNFTTGGSGIAWLTPADLGKHTGLYVSHGERDLTPKGLRSSSATVMPRGSVLFTSRAPIGYTAIAATEVSTNQGFKSVVPYVPECNLYIGVYFRAFATWIDGKAPGTTFREVSGKIVANLPFPIPPLAEQHRIVTKVDELMALCDRLEAAQAERERRRDRLAAASLHRLNQPTDTGDAAAFHEHAHFHLRHLQRLTTRSDQIPGLRQTILSLAVRGRLVPQDPSDGLTSDLLKRIQADKERLLVERKTRGQDQFLADKGDETPFDVPSNWKWVSLGEVLASSFYGPRFGSDEYSKTGIPTIRTTDMTKDGRIVLRDPPKVIVPSNRLEDFRCEKDDLLITRTGSIGTMAVFSGDYTAIPSAYLIRLRFTASTSAAYIYSSLRSPYGQTALGLNTTKVAQPNINAKNLAAIPIPLPPLAEQHRIVAKLNELMAVCDRLEAQLTTEQTGSLRLLEAVLHEALVPAA